MSIIREKYSLIIFDWDGTLMDSTGRIISAMQTTARNVELPIPTDEQVKSIIGLGMKEVLDKLFPMAGEEARAMLLEEYRFQYVEGDSTPTPLFEGSLSLLNWLKEKRVLTSVATGKARNGLQRVMNEVGLIDFFDHSVCADEAESKPSPSMIDILLENSGKTKRETLVIGDSIHDLQMAVNAGVDALGVTSGANSSAELEQHQPIAILESVCHFKAWASE
ncbi:MAG: HAD-IA family hydrolase [Kangiellaceae bacterium]|nr:HAD-IA family hydrolase [Kangiellaceae bacterium]MCW9000673.1 HAD-IA family hydrolase [Kangiellaceae bacterium]MCW9017582.1 HAD-IA family hydrolase [Kangiellaceae bacterium]